MIWVKIAKECECSKCKGASRAFYVDLAKAISIFVSHDEPFEGEEYFPIYAQFDGDICHLLKHADTLESANTHANVILTMLCANYSQIANGDKEQNGKKYRKFESVEELENS